VQHNSLEKDLEKFLLFQKIFRYQITFYSMLNSLNSLYFVKKIFQLWDIEKFHQKRKI